MQYLLYFLWVSCLHFIHEKVIKFCFSFTVSAFPQKDDHIVKIGDLFCGTRRLNDGIDLNSMNLHSGRKTKYLKSLEFEDERKTRHKMTEDQRIQFQKLVSNVQDDKPIKRWFLIIYWLFEIFMCNPGETTTVINLMNFSVLQYSFNIFNTKVVSPLMLNFEKPNIITKPWKLSFLSNECDFVKP